MFEHGDRVRCTITGDDGLPLVRYGFVRSMYDVEAGPVVVTLDGEISSEVIALDDVEPVAITSIELRLDGEDLLSDPELRRGLMGLWRGEAESAGLDVSGLIAALDYESDHCWTLAKLTRGDDQYVLRAFQGLHDPVTVYVRADRVRS